MPLAHLYRPITDSQGNLRTNCTVALYDTGGSSPTATAFFSDRALTQQMQNPFDCPSGIVDVYFADAARVDVGITPQGEPEVIIHDIDTTELPAGAGGGWTDYTPVVTGTTSDPVFADGTVFGRYQVTGKTLDLSIWVVNGPTTAGSGAYQFHLPTGMSIASAGNRYQSGTGLWIPNGGSGLVPGLLVAFSNDQFVLVSTIAGAELGDGNFPPGSGLYASGRLEIN